MKNLAILLLFTSVICYSQTEYYTTDGKNRLTKTEAKKMLSDQVDRMEKLLGKKFYGNLSIGDTETKKDSIIHNITFVISLNKENNFVSLGLLSEYKNKEFPKFDLNTLVGKNFNSEKLKGKPTMINFWFTKCAPCIDEMPILNKIKEKYKDDFNFIAITYEKEKDVMNFLKKHPFNFKHLINAKDFIDLLEIKTYPMNLFLDKEGVLKYVKRGIPYLSKKGEKLKIGDGNEMIQIIEKLKQ